MQGNPGLPGERGETGPRVSKFVEVMNSETKEKYKSNILMYVLLTTVPLFSQASREINCLKKTELLTLVRTDIVSFKLFYHHLDMFTFNQNYIETIILQ